MWLIYIYILPITIIKNKNIYRPEGFAQTKNSKDLRNLLLSGSRYVHENKSITGNQNSQTITFCPLIQKLCILAVMFCSNSTSLTWTKYPEVSRIWLIILHCSCETIWPKCPKISCLACLKKSWKFSTLLKKKK